MAKNEPRVNAGKAGSILGLPNVTAFYELVLGLMERSSFLPGWGVFYGRAGLGKTVAATRTAINLDCIYIECGPTWNSSTLMDNILHELMERDLRGTVNKKLDRIINILSESPRPLIFDEANFLIDKRLVDVVRYIHLKTLSPIVLIGEENIHAKLIPYDRAHSRVSKWVAAEYCRPEDARALAEANAPEVKLADDLLKHFVEQCHGVTRYIVSNIDRARVKAIREQLTTIDLQSWVIEDTYAGNPPRTLRRAGK